MRDPILEGCDDKLHVADREDLEKVLSVGEQLAQHFHEGLLLLSSDVLQLGLPEYACQHALSNQISTARGRQRMRDGTVKHSGFSSAQSGSALIRNVLKYGKNGRNLLCYGDPSHFKAGGHLPPVYLFLVCNTLLQLRRSPSS